MNIEKLKKKKYKYIIVDLKFFYHAVRLVNSCVEIFTDKTVYVNRRGRDADYLIKVRKGLVSLEELNEYVQSKLELIEELYIKSDLPEEVNMEKVKQLVITLRK